MTRQSIAVVGLLILAIFLGRILLKRVDSEPERIEQQIQVMYLINTANVTIDPDESSDVLYKLSEGDSVSIRDYNDEWKELYAGGFLPTDVLIEIRE